MTTGSSDPTSGCVSERLESSVSKGGVHPQVPSSVTHSHPEVATTPVSMDGWTDEHSGSIHLADRHSAPKRKDILMPATAWMDLEDSVLSKVSWPHF